MSAATAAIPTAEVTRGLATWAAHHTPKANTASAETWARHALLDWFACTIAGAALTGPSTRTPTVVPPQSGAVPWSPVTSDVRRHTF